LEKLNTDLGQSTDGAEPASPVLHSQKQAGAQLSGRKSTKEARKANLSENLGRTKVDAHEKRKYEDNEAFPNGGRRM
jgi:hypothetical protein